MYEKYMSTPPARISLSELWVYARILNLLSITVKCKILKLSTKKNVRVVFRQPPPPPTKKKKKKNPGSAYRRLTDYSCIDSLHGPPFNQITACITKMYK